MSWRVGCQACLELAVWRPSPGWASRLQGRSRCLGLSVWSRRDRFTKLLTKCAQKFTGCSSLGILLTQTFHYETQWNTYLECSTQSCARIFSRGKVVFIS
uniref:Uncharacterized protein n=1 Tax=Ixodes ricinus TaxID=34613 RepID=A0A6B0UFT5_IXORI